MIQIYPQTATINIAFIVKLNNVSVSVFDLIQNAILQEIFNLWPHSITQCLYVSSNSYITTGTFISIDLKHLSPLGATLNFHK